MDTMRLFIAVNIDSPDLRSSISHYQSRLDFRGVKLVDPELFHFSLHFLGETSSELIPQLNRVIDGITQTPFTLTLDHAGVFPNLRNIRVLWIGTSSGSEELIALQQQLIQPLQELQFSIDSRPYTPHLTIGRVKFLNAEAKPSIQHAVKDHESFLFGSQEVTQVHLMQSTLTPEGPIYQSLYTKDL